MDDFLDFLDEFWFLFICFAIILGFIVFMILGISFEGSSRCWHICEAGDYCSDCGVALKEYCPECGHVVGKKSFCSFCGIALK